ncbi:hypothetical protein BGZ50_000554, partial [Haplosporangium sp. Z 11]
MTDKLLTLFCLVDGEATPFSVDHLKNAIKLKKTNGFNDVDTDKLILWHVSIPLTPLHER